MSSTVSLSRRQALVERDGLLLRSSLLAADVSNGDGPGFQLRDVRFFYLLFGNWLEYDVTRPGGDVDLTQLRRAVERLREQGWATSRRLPGARARVALTLAGVLGLAEDLLAGPDRLRFEECAFLLLFTSSYASPLLRRARGQARGFAGAIGTRLAEVLSPTRVLERGKRDLASVIHDLEQRLAGGERVARAVGDLRRRGASDAEIVARLDPLDPYQLQRVRPLRQVLAALPEDLRAFELDRGMALRRSLLFEPQLAQARAELALLEGLAGVAASSLAAATHAPPPASRPAGTPAERPRLSGPGRRRRT